MRVVLRSQFPNVLYVSSARLENEPSKTKKYKSLSLYICTSMSTLSIESKFRTPTQPMAKRLAPSGADVICISIDTPYDWWTYLLSWQSIEPWIFFYENKRTPSTKLSKYLVARSFKSTFPFPFPFPPSHPILLNRQPLSALPPPLWPSFPPQPSPWRSPGHPRPGGCERRQTAPTAHRRAARPSAPPPRRHCLRRIRRAA